MCIGEAAPAEIRHWVRLAPYYFVEHPEAQILQRSPDAEDVVIAADHPQASAGLQNASARFEPGAGELIVGCEATETVPVVVAAIDAGVVGPVELVVELKIVGGVGEDEIDGSFGQGAEDFDAITADDRVARERCAPRFPHPHHATRYLRNATRAQCCRARVKAGLTERDWLARGSHVTTSRRALGRGVMLLWQRIFLQAALGLGIAPLIAGRAAARADREGADAMAK